MKELASRLLEVLIKKGDGRGAFAQKAGISPAVLSHIASGRNAPSLEIVLAILKIYPDVSPDWLLMGKGAWLRKDENTSSSEPRIQSSNDLFSNQEGQELQNKKNSKQEDYYTVLETAQLKKKIEELRFLLKLHARNAEESISDLEIAIQKIRNPNESPE